MLNPVCSDTPDMSVLCLKKKRGLMEKTRSFGKQHFDLVGVIERNMMLLTILGLCPYKIVPSRGINTLVPSRPKFIYCSLVLVANIFFQVVKSFEILQAFSRSRDFVETLVQSADQIIFLINALLSPMFILFNSKRLCETLNKLNVRSAFLFPMREKVFLYCKKQNDFVLGIILSASVPPLLSTLISFFPRKMEFGSVTEYLYELIACFDLCIVILTGVQFLTIMAFAGLFFMSMSDYICQLSDLDQLTTCKICGADHLVKDALEEIISLYGPLILVNIVTSWIEIMYHMFFTMSPRKNNHATVLVCWLLYFCFHMVFITAGCIFAKHQVGLLKRTEY